MPGDRSLVVITGSHVLLRQHGLTGRPFFFLVAAWTWPARAHVRTCRAGAERSRLSLRTPGTASKGVTGIAWPGAARETGGGARNDRAGHAARASR